MSDDFFDQMMKILASGAQYRAADVDEAVLKELMSDRPAPVERAPQPAPPPERRSVPGPPPVREIRESRDGHEFSESAPAVPPVSRPSVAGMDWDALQQTVASCRQCGLCRSRNHTVFGEGNIHAELMFIGEGPGADEDAQGRPFVGKAGELLTRMITAMGFDRWNEVYIANIVKCRPPGNRNPMPAEADICKQYLLRQIELLKPEVIVLLGAVPLLYLFNLKGVTKLRGQWLDWNGIPVMPTLHPAFLLRDPRQKIPVWQDLQQVMKVFGKTPPPSRKA